LQKDVAGKDSNPPGFAKVLRADQWEETEAELQFLRYMNAMPVAQARSKTLSKLGENPSRYTIKIRRGYIDIVIRERLSIQTSKKAIFYSSTPNLIHHHP